MRCKVTNLAFRPPSEPYDVWWGSYLWAHGNPQWERWPNTCPGHLHGSAFWPLHSKLDRIDMWVSGSNEMQGGNPGIQASFWALWCVVGIICNGSWQFTVKKMAKHMPWGSTWVWFLATALKNCPFWHVSRWFKWEGRRQSRYAGLLLSPLVWLGPYVRAHGNSQWKKDGQTHALGTNMGPFSDYTALENCPKLTCKWAVQMRYKVTILACRPPSVPFPVWWGSYVRAHGNW